MNTQVLGISIDHVPVLFAWAESLGGIQYPLLSDFWPHGAVAETYGVLRSEGYSERAIFILDKDGIIRYAEVFDIGIEPDLTLLLDEIRVVDPEAALREPPRAKPVDLPTGGIVMYCTKFCQGCREARAWLEERQLQYTEVNVYDVPGAAEQVREWAGGYLVTPTFDIDGQIVVDFDKEKLSAILE